MSTAPPLAAPPPPSITILWTRLALFCSVVGVVGSVYLSAEMDLKACSLCFYQRAFMMSAATILCLGLLLRGVSPAALSPLALAPTAAGEGIAVFHTYLVQIGFLECPKGMTNALTAPEESLIVFTLLLLFLLIDLFHQGRYVPLGLAAIILGGVLAVICLLPKVTPPPPEPKSQYTTPLDGCRRVFQGKATK